MTEIVQHQPSTDLDAQMAYAKAVSSANILPQAYRGKPADIMLAVGLGSAMGLSPAESLYRIDIIQGSPTASAELIASNVRKAGHTLRVRVDEQNTSVTATIIRKDDPDYEHTVVRDMAWAKKMGLDSRDNYRKQALTMLQWRAITAVARLAASECLFGVQYTADELTDTRPAQAPQQPVSVASLTQQQPEPEKPPQAEALPVEEPDEAITDKTRKHLFALFGQKGIAEDEQLSGINFRLGTTYTSRSELTEQNGRDLIQYLDSLPDAGEQQ